MRAKLKIGILLLAAILLLNGCALLTLDQLYYPPKRSDDYDNLQSLIDEAMKDLTYSAPISGENRQAGQTADLDGDGVDEYLLFAKDDSENPLKILIFSQVASGYVLMDTIEGYGFAFDFVEFAQMDDRDGLEIIVGRQVSEEVPRAVSVYRFTSDFARQLLSTGYNGITVCDLNEDGVKELMILSSGPSDRSKGIAVHYAYSNDEMRRSEVSYLSQSIVSLQQVENGLLQDGTPAVFATTLDNENTLTIDVFAVSDDGLVNVSGGIKIQSVSNYMVYPTDIDGDGIVEFPQSVALPPVTPENSPEFILEWYAIDFHGNTYEKRHTYHHFGDGWYLNLDADLESGLSVEQTEDGTDFYLRDEESGVPQKMMTIFTFTGSDREQQASLEGRILLYKSDSMICVAELEDIALRFGITAESLLTDFKPIRQEWSSDESEDKQ